MLQYRWVTPALLGKWWATKAEALRDAVSFGQAECDGDTIVLHDFVRIEESQEGPLVLR
jgi:hypothetical protein